MAAESGVVAALEQHYLRKYPVEAAAVLERLDPIRAAEVLAPFPVGEIVPVCEALSAETLEQLHELLPERRADELLAAMTPSRAAALLHRLDETSREAQLGRLARVVEVELRALIAFPEDSAGRLMDTRVPCLQAGMLVDEALARLRRHPNTGMRSLVVVDEAQRPVCQVDLYELLVADGASAVQDLPSSFVMPASALAPREELVEILERRNVTELPVVDFEGRYLGAIHASNVLALVQEDTAGDLLSMVGASREEHALSSPAFAVRKRLPWLQINLLTAFLASAVVGLFESTIAQFTALAVLLPVVAGQSGNSGSQALAVTMRGLALREISLRHWPGVLSKELWTGLLNGIAVALVCALGVTAWSGSLGLALVISISMVLAMVAAGCSGALIPILLQRFGQDPAAASSIILTTVTDIVGFFSFLGIATLLADLL